ncbi:hypothetical protein HUJ05_000184 [Dendroctonus ponderosae]|nr:hypothetical protein HUJ05_000184 [Dendroctonus ponderosae]
MENKTWGLSLLLLCSVFYSAIADDLTVQVKNGQIKGRVQTMLDGSTYYAWQGIPYGAPPVGNLRFQIPMDNHLRNRHDLHQNRLIGQSFKVLKSRNEEKCIDSKMGRCQILGISFRFELFNFPPIGNWKKGKRSCRMARYNPHHADHFDSVKREDLVAVGGLLGGSGQLPAVVEDGKCC